MCLGKVSVGTSVFEEHAFTACIVSTETAVSAYQTTV
jgi:hypothetical protein